MTPLRRLLSRRRLCRQMSALMMGLALFLCAHAVAEACMWDRDTLAEEQRGLPEITAIIVGRYERHTPEFLEHRIRTAQAALPNASPERAKALLDDIGVACDRLDRQDEAIAAMQRKIDRYGVDYTTAANLAPSMPTPATWRRRKSGSPAP